MSNNLDPDQHLRLSGPDLGLNCFHRLPLPVDDYSRQRVKEYI